MNDEQLLRYNRQIMLPQFDIAGQEKLLSSRVLIIGVGGLGSPAAMYLAAAGVGHITIADHDDVDLSNLQRQIVHTTDRIGQNKVDSAKSTLQALNPGVEVLTIPRRLTGQALADAIAATDVVLDCSDNFETRLEINRLSKAVRIPLVSGAAIRLEAQLIVFDHRREDSPCYECLYDPDTELNLSCSESGVLAPLVGVIGAMQALEAVKLLSGIGESSQGRLLLLDGSTLQWREMQVRRDPDCRLCHPRRDET